VHRKTLDLGRPLPSANAMAQRKTRLVSCWIMSVFFVVAGLNHFLMPDNYEQIMPPLLPWHLGLIYVSGVAEVLGGIGILIAGFRRFAGWGLIALLIAVFPANIYAAVHGLGSGPLSHWLMVIRLPFQAVLVFWVYWTCVVKRPASP
jgi:uncharacterized membrane protein